MKKLEEALFNAYTQGKMIEVHMESGRSNIRMSFVPENISVYKGIYIIENGNTVIEIEAVDDITYNNDMDNEEWILIKSGFELSIIIH